MAVQGRKKSRGGKLGRSQIVTIRLDPRLRYLAELAARKQRRTLSSYIEWVIEKSLDSVGPTIDNDPSFSQIASHLWDVDEPDRFAKLAIAYPELLTHEEQVLWKLIRENGYFWKGYHNDRREWIYVIDLKSLSTERLRKHWDDLLAVSKGEKPVDSLPSTKEEDQAHMLIDSLDDIEL